MCSVDLAYSKEHIDTFVIVSGDSDFSPLVSKLKELGKHVIGLGLAEATSDLLRDNCDEFIYYDDLDKAPAGVPGGMPSQIPEAKKKAFGLLIESLLALRRENKEGLFSPMVKDTMKRKKPSFNEEYHGYRTLSELLEDAASPGVIDIERHKGSGTYVGTRVGCEPDEPGPACSGRLREGAPRLGSTDSERPKGGGPTVLPRAGPKPKAQAPAPAPRPSRIQRRAPAPGPRPADGRAAPQRRAAPERSGGRAAAAR